MHYIGIFGRAVFHLCVPSIMIIQIRDNEFEVMESMVSIISIINIHLSLYFVKNKKFLVGIL